MTDTVASQNIVLSFWDTLYSSLRNETVLKQAKITVSNKTSKLVTVAARYKAWTVFARLNAGIVGSNPTKHGCLFAFILCLCFSV
jgi:hypothetical protein